MPELSNLLRQRLGLRTAPWVTAKTTAKTAVAGRTVDGKVNGEKPVGEASPLLAGGDAHPDPDVLTAYVERLLSSEERNQVMHHLAACGQCRDIVLLSLPDVEVAANVQVTLPTGRGWRALFSPGFGLAASAVAVAVMIGVLVEFPRKSPAPAPNATQTQNAQNADDTKQEIPSAAPSLVANDRLESATTRPEPKVALHPSTNVPSFRASAAPSNERQVYDVRPRSYTADVVSAPPVSIAGFAREDYLNAGMFSTEAAAPEGSSVAKKDLPPAPAPRGVVNAWSLIPNSTQIPDFTGLESVTPGANQRASFRPPRNPGHTLVSGLLNHVFQKQPPITARALSFAMGGAELNPAKDKSQSVEVTAAAPALDGAAGNDLARVPAFTRRARAEAPAVSDYETKAGAAQLYWKIAGGKLLKFGESGAWTEAYGDDRIEFSTFAAHGSEVWAGGHDAALVHSRDGGATWERITLGSAASGTIVKIEASALIVQVISSSGQSWLSVDGGTTWARQD